MIGRRIAHYQVERSLGSGGMGEVYLARDLALARSVALKLLPSEFSASQRQRLLWEAQAAARLQHPGIATFFEAGEADGTAFIAMEYVPGETLRSRLERGPAPAASAIAWCACVLEALSHAHAVGILHRDVKPENIMITGERTARLLDFGLAKQVAFSHGEEAPTVPMLTRDGAVVGTLGYMSPEQIKGERLDARSDLFCVGAVLHESITGRPVFDGRTPAERLIAALSKDPAPISGAGIPAGLNAVLARALARDPSRRYPGAAVFLSDLRRVAEGQSVSTLPDTLAILDLQNLSGSPDDDWIGSGIAESLSVDLSRVGGLTVVMREKVLRAAAAAGGPGRSADALEVALTLGCRWVLSGGFQRVGPSLRVTTRLVETSTGDLVAACKLDGEAREIFAIQDRLAEDVAESLDLRRVDAGPAAADPDVGAYEEYARGRRMWLRLEKGSFDLARERYESAVDADPGYAPALAGLAAVHALRFTFTTDPSDLARSVAFARQAITADPLLDEPHVWLGYALWRQSETEQALEALATARRLGSGNPYSHYFAGCCLGFRGRHEEAMPMYQQALAIDPDHGWSWLGLGWTHLELGHPEEAIWSLGKAVETERKHGRGPTAGVSGYLGECLRRLSRLEEARARCLDGLEAVERSDHMYRDSFRGVCLCALGRTALAQGDLPAARAAFTQAVTHLKGRSRALGGGHLLAQALAGLARTGAGTDAYEEAVGLFTGRKGFDFSQLWVCTDDVTLLELSRAARAVSRSDDAASFERRARQEGSTEAP